MQWGRVLLSGIKIERMTDENVECAAVIERECFSLPWSLTSLKSELLNPCAAFFVAMINGEAAGYAGMHHVVDEGYVTNIAVLPRYRRRGVASALLENYFRYAQAHGLRMITLEVRESNAGAIAFYEKTGFRVEGKRSNFYTNPVEDGMIMTVYFNKQETLD